MDVERSELLLEPGMMLGISPSTGLIEFGMVTPKNKSFYSHLMGSKMKSKVKF